MSQGSYDLFLSYSWRDRESAEGIARRLKERGLHVFLDRWYLVPGRPWIEILEEVVNECGAIAVLLGPNGMGSWQQREKNLALSRQAHDLDFPVIPTLLPGADSALGFLSLETWVDLRGGLDDEEALQVLELAVRGEPPGPDALRCMREVRSSVCPYRGLRPFREEDEPFFFGREDYTAKLAKMVERHSLVAVVGASGSGKSSVVRAGLVPRARQGIGGHLWEVATLVPGESPLKSLAAALLPFLEPHMTEVDRLREVIKLAQAFQDNQVSLSDVVARILEMQRGTDRLLLVVDQWEEIYTLSKDDQARSRFIGELLDATGRGSLWVVLTLRGDFFGRTLEHRLLADRLQNRVVNLGPMTRKELERVIEEPALKVGLRMESRLKERILDDVREAPGSLPYLEFVLTRMWEERHAGQLTHAAYESLDETGSGQQDSGYSPMQRVISGYAELQVRALLDSGHEEETLRRLLLQLVQAGEEHEATRRHAMLATMGEKARLLVRHLADARLLVTSRDEASGEETVELAHEALIGSWQRLKTWIDQDREFLLWRRRLEAAMDSWHLRGEGSSDLLRGGLLNEARQWKAKCAEHLSSETLRFIQTSERAAKFRKGAFSAGIVAAFLLVSILVAISLLRQIETQDLLAESYWASGQRAVENQRLLRASHSFARAAAQYRKASDIRIVKTRLFTLGSVVLLALFDHDDSVLGAVFSRDESRVLSWSADGTVQLWNAVDGSLAAEPMEHDQGVLGAVFSRDENRVLSWSLDGTVRLWNAVDGSITVPPMKHVDWVKGAAFSRDGSRVLSWSEDGTVRLWNAADGSPAAEPMKHEGPVAGAVFNRNENRVLSWSKDGTVRLWNGADGSPVTPPMRHEGSVNGTAFSHDETRVLSWSKDGTVRLWNAADGSSATVAMKHDGEVYGASFSLDDRFILSWSWDETVRLWNAADGSSRVAPMKHDGLVFGAMFSRDASRVLSWSTDNTAQFWNATDGTPATAPMKHNDFVSRSVFTRDGDRVLTLSADGTAQLWNTADGSQAAAPMQHDSYVSGAVFSRDENRVLTWSEDGTARLWTTSDGFAATPSMKHGAGVRGAVFSRDESRVLTWRLWKVTDSFSDALSMKHRSQVNGAAFSRDEERVLSWSADETVQLWNSADGSKAAPPMKHHRFVHGAIFSRDESRVLSWSDDGTVQLWNAADSTPAAGPMKHDGLVFGATFSQDETKVLSWSADGTARLWNADGTLAAAPMKHDKTVNGAVFNRDESRILSWSNDNTARLWRASDGSPLSFSMTHSAGVLGATFSRNERLVLTWSYDGTARLWKAADGLLAAPPMRHGVLVLGAAFSRDDSRILTWGDGVRLVKSVDGSQIIPPIRHNGPVAGAVFNRDESIILTWSEDHTARLWNVANGALVIPPMRHEAQVMGAVFSGDESLVLTWSEDGTARLWRAADGTLVTPPMEHNSPVSGAVFSRDEDRVLTWSIDGTIGIWNLQADYDFPQEHLTLQVEVATGTQMDERGNVTALDSETRRRRKAEYIQIAEKHWKSCRYKDANLYAVLREYWPKEEK